MATRPLLVVLLLVTAVLFVSWLLGEALRQRKTTKRRRKQ